MTDQKTSNEKPSEIKVKVKKTFPQIDFMFKEGDIVDLIYNRREEDQYYPKKQFSKDKGTGEWIQHSIENFDYWKDFSDTVKYEKGSVESFSIRGVNGLIYSLVQIRNYIGYQQSGLDNMFEKI